MVLMMLPSALEELVESVELVEVEAEFPLRSAIELSMKDAMIDCADGALEDAAPDAVAEELEVPPVRAPINP